MGLLDDIPGVKDVQLNGVALTRRSKLNIVMSGATSSDDKVNGITTLMLVPIDPTFSYVSVGTAPFSSSGTIRGGAGFSIYSNPDGASDLKCWADLDTTGTFQVGDVLRPLGYFEGLRTAALSVDGNGHVHVVPFAPSSYDYTNPATNDAVTAKPLADMMLAISGVPDNAIYRLNVEIQADDGAGNIAVYEGQLICKRVAGVLSISKNAVYESIDEIGLVGPSFAPNAANDGIAVNVFGKLGTTVNWQLEDWSIEGKRL